MNNADKKQFTAILLSVCEAYSKNYTDSLYGIWWELMIDCSIDKFSWAMSAHVRTSKYFPRPAEILEKINGTWMDANEAWARMPKNEEDTAVVSKSMLAAWSVASESYYSGDEIGARMAFKGAYDRHMKQSMDRGLTEVFSLSIGSDSTKRQPAISAAVQSGLITHEEAKKHMHALPAPSGGVIAGLITGKISEESAPEELREKWAGIKKMINEKSEQLEAERQAVKDRKAAEKESMIDQLKKKIALGSSQ